MRESNGVYEGKFVMATISLESEVPVHTADEEHVSGTEDELSADEDV